MDLRNCCQGEHMEKFDFGRKKLLGIVFDLSIRHDKQGGRIIDMVKKQLVSRIASSDENLLVVVSDAAALDNTFVVVAISYYLSFSKRP